MHNLLTILDWVRYACSTFQQHDLYYGHGTDNAFDDAVYLILSTLDLPLNLEKAYWQAKLTELEKEKLASNINRRINEKLPVAYITHKVNYGGFNFYIDSRALIPRSPIAELIDKQFQPYIEDFYPYSILDLCCGSGCIGILAKQYYVDSIVTLSDIDEDALAVAKINIDKFKLQNDIEIIQSDLFNAINGQYDLIVCNPPYVESGEMESIAKEYTHEPLHALISGTNGMDIVKIILKQAPDFLTDNGYLVLEVGMSWPILEDCYPDIAFNWISFEYGGEGVFIVSKDELLAWQIAGLLN